MSTFFNPVYPLKISKLWEQVQKEHWARVLGDHDQGVLWDMRLEKAFSLQANQSITARKADHLFHAGEINSKYEFQCPDDKCNAQVTCANLDKPPKLRKRDPYYMVVSKHSHECNIGKDIINEERRKVRSTESIYSEEDEYFVNTVRLNLQPPSNRRPGGATNDAEGDDANVRIRGTKPGEKGKRKIQPSQVLSSMIDEFINGNNFDVQLPGNSLIKLQDMFIEINGQDISQFSDEFRIYYGKAWINKRENGYSVTYEKKLWCSTTAELKRPSFFIGHDMIDASTYQKFQRRTFEKNANTTPKMVYIISENGPYLSKNGKYINLWLEGLSYMDYKL